MKREVLIWHSRAFRTKKTNNNTTFGITVVDWATNRVQKLFMFFLTYRILKVSLICGGVSIDGGNKTWINQPLDFLSPSDVSPFLWLIGTPFDPTRTINPHTGTRSLTKRSKHERIEILVSCPNLLFFSMTVEIFIILDFTKEDFKICSTKNQNLGTNSRVLHTNLKDTWYTLTQVPK